MRMGSNTPTETRSVSFCRSDSLLIAARNILDESIHREPAESFHHSHLNCKKLSLAFNRHSLNLSNREYVSNDEGSSSGYRGVWLRRCSCRSTVRWPGGCTSSSFHLPLRDSSASSAAQDSSPKGIPEDRRAQSPLSYRERRRARSHFPFREHCPANRRPAGSCASRERCR